MGLPLQLGFDDLGLSVDEAGNVFYALLLGSRKNPSEPSTLHPKP